MRNTRWKNKHKPKENTARVRIYVGIVGWAFDRSGIVLQHGFELVNAPHKCDKGQDENMVEDYRELRSPYRWCNEVERWLDPFQRAMDWPVSGRFAVAVGNSTDRLEMQQCIRLRHRSRGTGYEQHSNTLGIQRSLRRATIESVFHPIARVEPDAKHHRHVSPVDQHLSVEHRSTASALWFLSL